MKKVYCENCKYSKVPIFCDRLSKKNKFTDVNINPIQFKKNLNSDGKCIYYKNKKRKNKWKFWIKED